MTLRKSGTNIAKPALPIPSKPHPSTRPTDSPSAPWPLLAPRTTPRAIVDRLHKEVVRAVQRPDVVQRLALDGTEGIASSPADFDRFLKAERDRWTKVVKVANIRD